MKTHVCNNQSLTHDTNGARYRTKKYFKKPRVSTIVLEENMQVNGCASKKDPIWIFASSNEIIHHQNCDEIAKTVSIENVKTSSKCLNPVLMKLLKNMKLKQLISISKCNEMQFTLFYRLLECARVSPPPTQQWTLLNNKNIANK